MAIKFSQFVVQTDASTLSHIVGYNGADNIQITPTNFLNSLLTGTPGQVLYYDTTGVAGENAFFWDNTNKRLGIGTNTPSYKVHIKDNSVTTGSKTLLQLQSDPINNGGSLNLDFRVSSANVDDRYVARISGMREGNGALSQLQFWTESAGLNQRMTITSAGNVGIGTATPTSKLEVDGDMSVTPGGVILLPDNSFLRFGTSSDATIYHDTINTYFKNFTGNIILQNNKDNADIVFQSDDGSGGVTTYFFVDGSAQQVKFSKNTEHQDNVQAQFGAGSDLKIYHDGSGSYLENVTGHLYLMQRANGEDMIFMNDDGSGGDVEYFRLDGSLADGTNVFTKFADNSWITMGSGGDLLIGHQATSSKIENYTGPLYIVNKADDADIIFQSDNGSGGVATYFYLDGSLVNGTSVKGATRFPDASKILMGSGGDLEIFHNGSQTYIENYTGEFNITQHTNDGDMLFKCDDGAGGVATYFYLDGSDVMTRVDKRLRMSDAVSFQLGSNGNFEMYHLNGNTTLDNFTGNLTIRNSSNDKDISFACDDGSGGAAEYFRLDGSTTKVQFSKNIKLIDNVKLDVGSGADLQLFHNGTDSVIENNTGDLYITNKADDKDIIFRSDNGSGSFTTYFYLDGGNVLCRFEKSALFADNVSASFGNGFDLQIYHDNLNTSYIKHITSGDFRIQTSSTGYIKLMSELENMAVFIPNNAVELYFDNSKKFQTTSTGVRISGVSEYANNTAALAAGLAAGDVYRTGDDLKIVH